MCLKKKQCSEICLQRPGSRRSGPRGPGPRRLAPRRFLIFVACRKNKIKMKKSVDLCEEGSSAHA